MPSNKRLPKTKAIKKKKKSPKSSPVHSKTQPKKTSKGASEDYVDFFSLV